jgi:hypothetical protein
VKENEVEKGLIKKEIQGKEGRERLLKKIRRKKISPLCDAVITSCRN